MLWGLTSWILKQDDGVNQKAIKACVKKAVTLQERRERELFLRGMIEKLDSSKIDSRITDGIGRVYDLNRYQQGKVAFLKFLGIDLFSRYLCALENLPWGGRSGDFLASDNGPIGRQVLFSGVSLPLQKTYGMRHACATAAIKACHEVGLACSENEMEVILRTHAYDFNLREDSMSYATMLVLEFMYGHFGQNVTSFLCCADLFSRM
jgi:hypothetical protein